MTSPSKPVAAHSGHRNDGVGACDGAEPACGEARVVDRERVLVWAPRGRDAAQIMGILRRHQIAAELSRCAAELAAALDSAGCAGDRSGGAEPRQLDSHGRVQVSARGGRRLGDRGARRWHRHPRTDAAARVRRVRADRGTTRSLAGRPGHRAHRRQASGRATRRACQRSERRARQGQCVLDRIAPAGRGRRPSPPSSRLSSDALLPISVLVVEDNDDLLEMTRDILAGFGCEVSIARDGPSGLERLASAPAGPGLHRYRAAGAGRLLRRP
jgi:hypothetical protein